MNLFKLFKSKPKTQIDPEPECDNRWRDYDQWCMQLRSIVNRLTAGNDIPEDEQQKFVNFYVKIYLKYGDSAFPVNITSAINIALDNLNKAKFIDLKAYKAEAKRRYIKDKLVTDLNAVDLDDYLKITKLNVNYEFSKVLPPVKITGLLKVTQADSSFLIESTLENVERALLDNGYNFIRRDSNTYIYFRYLIEG